MRSLRHLLLVVAGVVVVALLLALLIGSLRGGVSEEAVREAVVTTLQQEAPESFLVTGRLDLTATTRVENTKTFLPDVLDLSLGTTTATVRVPGSARYGFDVRALEPDDIEVGEDGRVRVRLPELRVLEVAPRLSQLEVQTDVGWARTRAGSGRSVERRALAAVERGLREQAERHLETSVQPRLNTARALEALLVPVLRAAGVDDPRVEIVGEAWRIERGEGG